MKTKLFMMITFVVLTSLTAFGQIARQDVKWARKAPAAITLDGVLSEPAWAAAESVNVVYGQSSGMPGSGWYDESPIPRTPSDPTRATVKFLSFNDTLYVAYIVKDSSVGGGLFNKFDGILANIRRRDDVNRPVRDGEIFYAWCSESWADTQCVWPGAKPAFLGGLAGGDPYHPRPDSLKNIWDAVTTVQGSVNNDTTKDQGYTIEMKINLKERGYNITQVGGDIAMFSFSIYDADWQWPLVSSRFTGNRVWYQCPWGNANAYGHIRIYARSDVTTTSGPVPVVGPELTVPIASATIPSPVIDGSLNDLVWSQSRIGTLPIKYGDAAIRNAYPSTAPYRSGQFQPTVNGGQAAVQDPNLATVKYFFKGDSLFFGFDVKDRVVQFFDSSNVDRWDGFRVTICDRAALNPDNVLWPRQLTFIVAGSGTNAAVLRQDLNLASGSWDSAGTNVRVALKLKGGTTIDTLGATADSGYTAEMRINLRALGYPAGLGDHLVFFAVTHFDGDSFTPPSTSYGTRTWFMREAAFNDGAIWAYMDPSVTTGVNENGGKTGVPAEFALMDNYPNPFNPTTTMAYNIPKASQVTLEVYNMLGQRVSTLVNEVKEAGYYKAVWNGRNEANQSVASGMYIFKMTAGDFKSAKKMLLLK